MQFKIKTPRYHTISKVVFLTALFFLVTSIISFFWTVITVGRFYIDFTSQGWNDFLSYL